MLALQIYVKFTAYSLPNDAIRLHVSTTEKDVIRICVLTLIVFVALPFQRFDLENFGQGHRVQHCRIPALVRKCIFTLALTVSEILRFEMLTLKI